MSGNGVQVFKCEDVNRWFCVVPSRDLKVGVELEEEVPGSGDRSVVGLEVRPVAGGLTVGVLRDAPYGDAIRRARTEVERAVADRMSRVMSKPSDPPPAFRGDRRGRSPRTERDYAQLASSYLAMRRDARRHAAATWADEFPGSGSKRTWLNRLVRARRYVAGESLTQEGVALIFGDELTERLEFDDKWGSALSVATMNPGGRIWRTLQRDGKDPREWQRAARQSIQIDEQGERS